MNRVRLGALLLLCLAAGLFAFLAPPPVPSAPTSHGDDDAGVAPSPDLLGAESAYKVARAPDAGDAGALLTIAVRALSGDQPVPAAQITIRDRGKVVATGSTDEAGLLTLDVLPRADLQVVAEAIGFTPSQVSIKPAEAAPPAQITLHLAGGHNVEGRVVDEEGQPVAGAIVEATSATRIGSARIPARLTRTRKEGIFEIADLPAGHQVLSARWPKGWKGPGQTVRVPLRTPIDLTLRRGATIEGTITSADTGQGLGAATVRVASISYGMSASVRTDEQGNYSLGPLDPSAAPAYLRVTRPGYRPATQDALADRGLAAPHPSIEGRSVLDLRLGSGDRVRLDFSLDTGAVVVGTVRGPDGPLPNALVRPVPPRGASWTRTNAEGEYRLVALAARPVLIAVQAPGFLQDGAVHPLPSRDLELSDAFQHMGAHPVVGSEVVRDVRMERGLVLHIRVLDMGDEPLVAERLWVRNERGTSQPVVTRSKAGGFAVSGVASGGQLVIGATLDGYEGAEPQGIRITQGTQDGAVLVRMRRRKTLTVRGSISSRQEAELRGAYVQVAWVDRSGYALDPVGRLKLWASSQRHPVREDGSFTVRLAGAPGRFAVRASALGHVAAYSIDEVASAGTVEAEVHLTLAAGHRLAGHVLDASSGDSIPGALIRLTSAGANNGTAPMWYVTPTATDASGSFAVTEVSAGTYLLEVHATGFGAEKLTIQVPAPAETTTIELARADGEIGGTVESDAGMPLLGARLHAVQGTTLSRPVRSRADGSFLLRGLRHAPATVGADADGQVAAQAKDVSVGTRDLRFVLEPGVGAAGVALDQQGRPLARTWIHFQPSQGGHVGTWVRTDSAGRFRRTGLARGAHRLSLHAKGKRIPIGEVVLPDEDLVVRR
ncbi:MAG: hypothetical protein GY946_23945 [bacterium]|nr:hypothetical protein [bacterium]